MGKAARALESERSGRPFPHELEIHRFDMQAACTSGDDPVEWPEGEKILEAYAPEKLAQPLIKHFHHEIRNASIAYVWVENMGDGTRVKLGTAQRASSLIKFLGSVDFVLKFNHSAWKVLSFEQRVALIDHELSHCSIDSDSGLPVLVHHDVEEFGGIVRRYGLWKPDLQSFGDIVQVALQGDLWESAAAK